VIIASVSSGLSFTAYLDRIRSAAENTRKMSPGNRTAGGGSGRIPGHPNAAGAGRGAAESLRAERAAAKSACAELSPARDFRKKNGLLCALFAVRLVFFA
jgi:hypothetical protein